MHIYFVRHGESEANLLREFSNRGWKHSLTERGLEQARQLAMSLQAESIQHIYASPLMRAVQTADILGKALHVPVSVTEALREYDCGVLEGRLYAESRKQYHRVLEDWMERQNWESCIEEGESFLDMQARFVPFLEEVQTTYPPDANLALVGHGGLYRCMLPLVLANVDFAFAMQNSINYTDAIVAEWREGTWHCLSWGATAMSS
jgi:probable phosphoglycerate mutase